MIIFLLRRLWPLLVLAGVLAACTTAPPPPAFPELTYRHLGAITLDSTAVDIVDEYRPPLKDPNIEHKVPVPPALALRRWALDRLASTGNPDRRAVFTIQQAAMTETRLPRTKGLRGALTTDQSDRYDLTLAVRLELFEARNRVGIATATATRSRTVAEDITLNDRDRVLFEMVESTMIDLNGELENSIRQFLGAYVR